ncbi:SGNH/GDSL hydrolase family protein [Rhizobium ruizarguesonis]|uniref:SGNH/GDSL hydrolase family protein n=1 Tax=Rhizobium ruizarguesonis TaxID=2081791 RepID=UPI0013DF7464|nr:SGNH/GDSL hydrolase family protein [Rhizobium ruizarguesonis]NEJ94339.1 SGNH/GDSL hydrolase family protein [Rhizobium ruizarguesonis]
MSNSALLLANMNRQIEADIESRIRKHQEKVRAVKQAISITGLRSSVPYTAVAVGDSWFDYPLVNDIAIGQTDIIAQLELMHDHEKLILPLAHHGDATTDMMTQAKQQRLIGALSDENNWLNGKPDVIFCSAGGNDVAGDQFGKFLNFNDGTPGRKGLNSAKFATVLNVVRLNYETLFDLRDRYAPGVRIFAHTYDFPTPDNRHPICAGPWLYPSLKSKNWSVLQGKKIVADALKKFRAMLMDLQSNSSNRFSVIDTQGTLIDPDYTDDWSNELHPTGRGFKQLARKFDPHWIKRLQEDQVSELPTS